MVRHTYTHIHTLQKEIEAIVAGKTPKNKQTNIPQNKTHCNKVTQKTEKMDTNQKVKEELLFIRHNQK